MSRYLFAAERAKRVLKEFKITDMPAWHLDGIAASQRIKVRKKSLPKDAKFSGGLFFYGKQRGILINTYIDNPGRHNFTFGHELGHHFLEHVPSYTKMGMTGFQCSNKNMEIGGDSQEVEANYFAAELLMPEEQFRPMMVGATLDYVLISSLARRFYVSKHACCNRLLTFTGGQYIVVRSRGYEVTDQRASSTAYKHMMSLEKIPVGTAAYSAITNKKNQEHFTRSDPSKWLINLDFSKQLYEWTRGEFKHNVAMTILMW